MTFPTEAGILCWYHALIIKFPEASHMKLDLGYCLDATSRIFLCSSLHSFSRIRIAILAIAVVACHLSFRMLNSPSLTLIKNKFDYPFSYTQRVINHAISPAWAFPFSCLSFRFTGPLQYTCNSSSLKLLFIMYSSFMLWFYVYS